MSKSIVKTNIAAAVDHVESELEMTETNMDTLESVFMQNDRESMTMRIFLSRMTTIKSKYDFYAQAKSILLSDGGIAMAIPSVLAIKNNMTLNPTDMARIEAESNNIVRILTRGL